MSRILFLLLTPLVFFAAPLKILSITMKDNAVRIKFSQNIKQSYFKEHTIKSGIYYDINAELTTKKKVLKLDRGVVTIAQNTKRISRIVIETKNPKELILKIDKQTAFLSFKDSSSNSKNQSIADLFHSIDTKDKQDTPPPKKNTTPPPSQPSLSSNKVVVLDPGHGGKDCGAFVQKVCEKGITLSIVKHLEKELVARGYKVFMTRSSDKYISLTERTKFANDKNADIFISIHANALDKNSAHYKTTSGIETYFLSQARSERARKVAELENKDDIEVMNYFSKLSFLNSINSQRLLASNKLAIDIQSGILTNVKIAYTQTIDGGVREGPFWVLAGALMPSILVEVGYMTNEDELTNLRSVPYQMLLAQGIADGVDSYFRKNF